MLGRLAAWLLAGLLLAGCAGHAARTAEARSALDALQPQAALELIDDQLDVKTPEQVPSEVAGDNAILLLDRAMVLQQLDQYQLSSRDLQVADKAVEILDLSRNTLDDIGKYVFSDATGPYQAPAYEKLMINTMNMVNYLVRADLAGARVEARRLAVMQRFLQEHADPGHALVGPGSYLAGFVFEKSGDAQEALRYYDEALQYGSYASLQEPVQRLGQQASYRSPRITRLLGDPPQVPPDPGETGEILAIVSFGRVPAKYAERVPIGLALTYASGFISPADQTLANRLALQGLVTWVNYPELGRPRGTYSAPAFALDRRWTSLEGMLAVDREAKRAWDEQKGAVVASAITRMISRVVAGEAANQAAGKGVGGLLLSLGTQVAMTAADTPDTRSWSTLPARIAFGRVRVPPGMHDVVLMASGVRKTQRVHLGPRGWAVVNLTVLR